MPKIFSLRIVSSASICQSVQLLASHFLVDSLREATRRSLLLSLAQEGHQCSKVWQIDR